MTKYKGSDYPMPTYEQAMQAWCLLNELIKLGYPHNFQREMPHIKSYMCKAADLVKEAYAIREGAAHNEMD